MHRLEILVCAMTPALVLLQYGIAKAQLRWNDPTVWEAFFRGGISTVFVLLPEIFLRKIIDVNALSGTVEALVQAFVVAAIPEELAKLVAIFLILKRYGTGTRDVITVSLAVALGFAAVENLIYLIAPVEWPLLAASRAVLAVPMHGINGLAMGSFLTMALDHSRHRRIWFSAAFIAPVLLHAGYDFPLMLITKSQAFVGVLPAWILILALSTISILCLCNAVRASVERGFIPIYGIRTTKFQGAVLLLFVPILAIIVLVGTDNFGVLGAVVFAVVPTILGIDLLCTSSTSCYAAATDR